MSGPEPLQFGRYAITRILGRGAFGRVYLGYDSLRDRQVAVRVLDEGIKEQLDAVPQLSHTGIISIYEVGEAGRHSFVAMEFASGGSLEEQLENGVEFSCSQVIDFVGEIAEALDYAHGQGVIHQDICPANILISDDERYKLTDFRIDEITLSVSPGQDVKRLRSCFFSPEQVRGLPVTPSTDQFSLAVVVYRLLTGRQPFEGDTSKTVNHQVAAIDPSNPSVVNPELSVLLGDVVMKALSKEPSERYSNCRAFADALLSSLSETEIIRKTSNISAATSVLIEKKSWDETILDLDADELTLDSGVVQPLRSQSIRRSRFPIFVVGVFLLIGAAWLIWRFDLLGPPRIEVAIEIDSFPPGQSLAIWSNEVPTGLATPASVLLEGEEGESVRLRLVRDDEIVASTNLILDGVAISEWIPEVEVPVKPVRYEVKSNPTGALVRLDGQTIARPTPVDIDLFPGQSYEIMVELDGYEAELRSINPAQLEADVAVLDFALTRIVKPGRLLAEALFPVRVVARSNEGVESEAVGRSLSLELLPGSYSVSVLAPDVFFKGETTVVILEDEDVLLPDIPPAVKIFVFDVPGNATVQVDDFSPFPSGGPRVVATGAHRFVFEWPTGQQVVKFVEVDNEGQEVSARHP